MTVIKSPNGIAVEVDDENRMLTFATTQENDRHLTVEGKTFSVHFFETPTAANDYFFYFKNNGLKDLFLTKTRISSSVPSIIYIDHVTGTPVYTVGTNAETSNKNLGAASTLEADAIHDVDITGLTSGGTLLFEQCAVADTRYTLEINSNIIIPQGQAIALRREAATGSIHCVLSISVEE